MIASLGMPPPPRRLGPFVVGPRIGGGGMAAVHLGRSVIHDGDVVALKIVREELANDPKYVAMFSDEAQLLARLDHPNIVRTLEFGIAGEHRYIAMELLLGRTMAEVWDHASAQDVPLPVRLVAWIGARVADALHYAHGLVDDQGHPLHIVHRDANPSNVVVSYEGDVKLIDFGLAKAARRFARTEDGIVKGKVPYLAPEQVLEAGVDARTDVFTFGASLWEMLAMKRLFKRETDVETIRAIQSGQVPHLADEAPRCPTSLSNIVMRCLAHDPADRYQTAGELATALDGLYERDDDANRAVLTRLLERLFPGERAEREAWRTTPIEESKR